MKILKDILYGARISEVIGSTHIAVESVMADSRQIKPFGCFVAIPGTAVDGHDHIPGAVRAGAAAVVCERLPAPEDRTDQVVYIQVDNARSALGHLAANFHDNPTERLKVVAITGTNGKTVVAKLVAQMLQLSGKHTGLGCSDGLYLDRRQVESGARTDRAAWDACHRILMNRAVEAAVFESDSGMILSQGLPYDRCQVGVVTNFGKPDHLGDFYVEDEDRMVSVLRTQIDVVLKTGVGVLNAADARLVEMAELCDGEVIFFALSGDLEAIAAHRAAGKRAVFVRDGQAVLATGPTELALADVSAIPLTYDGRVPFQLENVLAAVATGWALGISNDLMRAGIMTFDVGQVDVPGRFTLFQHHGATIVVDDAHNASALEALAAALDNFPAQRRTLVFGAGLQRRDEDLVAQGTVIGQTFDRVLLCEDASVKRTDAEFDRQARALLKQGLQAGGRVAEVVVEGAKRRDVVDAALSQVTAGDLLVLQCDECAIEGTVQQVHQWMGRAESQN